MGALVETVRISEQEYLSSPAYRHCEYVDGFPVQLNVGSKTHSRIQIKIGRRLDEYFDSHPGGYVGTELHCRLTVRGATRYRLPDVAVVLRPDERPFDRYLEGAPDLVVEIRSPEDPVSGLVRKMDDYFANGTKLAWLILPEEQSVMIFTPDRPVRTAMRGEKLDAGELLPGLEVPVDELFA
jgi:Uma2 family endonuclease